MRAQRIDFDENKVLDCACIVAHALQNEKRIESAFHRGAKTLLAFAQGGFGLQLRRHIERNAGQAANVAFVIEKWTALRFKNRPIDVRLPLAIALAIESFANVVDNLGIILIQIESRNADDRACRNSQHAQTLAVRKSENAIGIERENNDRQVGQQRRQALLRLAQRGLDLLLRRDVARDRNRAQTLSRVVDERLRIRFEYSMRRANRPDLELKTAHRFTAERARQRIIFDVDNRAAIEIKRVVRLREKLQRHDFSGHAAPLLRATIGKTELSVRVTSDNGRFQIVDDSPQIIVFVSARRFPLFFGFAFLFQFVQPRFSVLTRRFGVLARPRFCFQRALQKAQLLFERSGFALESVRKRIVCRHHVV